MKKGWQRKQLGELAELRGRIGWRGLTAKEYTRSGPLFLSVHSLNYGDYVDFRDAFHISEERYVESPEIMLQDNDVLICKDGAGIGKVGIVSRLPDRATINSSLLLIRGGKEILPKFLYHCLSSPYFQQIVNSRLTGATTPHLYQRDITEFPVVLPPLSEQQRIVGILDKTLEGIATAKVNAEKNLQNARNLLHSHLQSVFARHRDDWKMEKLDNLTELARGHNPPKSKFSREQKPGYVRFYQIRDGATNDYAVYVPDTPQLHKMKKDDIMMVAYRHVGRVFRGVEGAFNVALCKISNARKDLLDNDFLFHIIPSEYVRGELLKRSERSLIPSMSIEHLREIKIPLPPILEQKRLVEIIKCLTGETQRLESVYQKKIASLDELKKSLLHQAFSGQL
ncbi:MAG: restriction endonuclease subunit S [Alphaproteobacteria bacterium]